MKYFIGADLGTSSLKMLLTDVQGAILGEVTKDYDVMYPQAGWTEQNPEDWWTAFKLGIAELTKDIDVKDIKGLSVAGQMHGLVVLDKDDKVVRPTILWNDGRTWKETDYLNYEIGMDKMSEMTGNIAFAGFTAPKIMWMKNNEPELFAKIDKIMLPKDYLNYRLTGTFATEYSDASGFLLLDVKNKCWSKGMLDICGITEEQMPKLYESYECIGTIKPEVAAEVGLHEGIVVAAGAGDNAGAALGTGTVGEGKCNISLGTSGTVFISSNNFAVDDNNSLHAFAHADGGFHLMGVLLSAASCNKWFCDEILKTKDYAAEQEGMTDEVLGTNHVYFAPYLTGERSILNDTDARGLFIGLRPDTSRQDMVLAVLEGVAFGVRQNIEVAKKLGIEISRSTLCGGGAKSPVWQKVIANVLNIEIDLPVSEQGPGMGGAILAMVAAGEYATVEECVKKLTKIRKTIKPEPAIAARYEEMYQKYLAIYPAVKELYKKLK